MAKQGIILGAVIVASVAAIGGGLYWSSQQPHRFVFDVALYDLDRIGRPAPEMKVFVNGAETPLGHVSGIEDPIVTAEGGLAKEFSADVLPAIQVQYRGACGWKAVKVVLEEPGDDELKRALSRGRHISTRAELKEDGWIRLYTDNRGQPAHRIELGGIAEDIAKDSSKTIGLVQDKRCAAGSEVKLDGKDIGALPDRTGHGDEIPGFVFDTSGKRCYSYRETSYVDDKFPDLLGTHERPTPKIVDLDPGYFHALPGDEVDYFLADAPETIVVPQSMTFPGASYMKSSLVETPCPGPIARPSPARRKAR
jgi:hypothetical protein